MDSTKVEVGDVVSRPTVAVDALTAVTLCKITRAGSVPRLLLPVRFGSVFSSKTRFRFFSVSVLLTTKTPPDVESASPSVGLI